MPCRHWARLPFSPAPGAVNTPTCGCNCRNPPSAARWSRCCSIWCPSPSPRPGVPNRRHGQRNGRGTQRRRSSGAYVPPHHRGVRPQPLRVLRICPAPGAQTGWLRPTHGRKPPDRLSRARSAATSCAASGRFGTASKAGPAHASSARDANWRSGRSIPIRSICVSEIPPMRHLARTFNQMYQISMANNMRYRRRHVHLAHRRHPRAAHLPHRMDHRRQPPGRGDRRLHRAGLCRVLHRAHGGESMDLHLDHVGSTSFVSRMAHWRAASCCRSTPWFATWPTTSPTRC